MLGSVSRPGVMPMPERQEGRIGRVVEHAIDLREESIVTKVLSFLPDRTLQKSHLAYADVVVAGGLGLQSD